MVVFGQEAREVKAGACASMLAQQRHEMSPPGAAHEKLLVHARPEGPTPQHQYGGAGRRIKELRSRCRIVPRNP